MCTMRCIFVYCFCAHPLHEILSKHNSAFTIALLLRWLCSSLDADGCASATLVSGENCSNLTRICNI